MENKDTLFLPTLATSAALKAALDALGSKNPVHVAFEIIEEFLSFLGMSDNVEAAACHRNVQGRNYTTIVRISCGIQWDNVNCLTALQLFIG